MNKMLGKSAFKIGCIDVFQHVTEIYLPIGNTYIEKFGAFNIPVEYNISAFIDTGYSIFIKKPENSLMVQYFGI